MQLNLSCIHTHTELKLAYSHTKLNQKSQKYWAIGSWLLRLWLACCNKKTGNVKKERVDRLVQGFGAKKRSWFTVGDTGMWGSCVKWLLWWALPQNTPLHKYTTLYRVSIRGSRDENLSKRWDETKSNLSKDDGWVTSPVLLALHQDGGEESLLTLNKKVTWSPPSKDGS